MAQERTSSKPDADQSRSKENDSKKSASGSKDTNQKSGTASGSGKIPAGNSDKQGSKSR